MSTNTAILLVDPLNEFLHVEGKVFPMLKESLATTDTIKYLQELVKTAREAHIPIYYCQHQLHEEGQFSAWKHKSKSILRSEASGAFLVGTLGAEIYAGLEPDRSNGDAIISRHWNSSSFANTDLDFQLRQRDITHVVCAGLVANTCLESTARYAVESGYHVTIVSDATAGFSNQLKDAAVNIIWPTIVDKVTTVAKWRESLQL